jgi:hypothetical protein
MYLDDNFEILGRTVSKMAHDLLYLSGLGHTAAAQHMKLLYETPEWTKQMNEPCYDVLEVVQEFNEKCAQHEKRANPLAHIATVTGLGSNLVQTLAVISVLSGAAVGAGVWGANRLKDEDTSEIAKLKAQSAVYEDLANQVEHKLNKKYKYNV